jgi:hypothetical protein
LWAAPSSMKKGQEFCYGVFGYLRGIWRYIRSPLISAVDFYCVINKSIILVHDPH